MAVLAAYGRSVGRRETSPGENPFSLFADELQHRTDALLRFLELEEVRRLRHEVVVQRDESRSSRRSGRNECRATGSLPTTFTGHASMPASTDSAYR